MLDIKFIRENPELVRKAVADRNDTAPIDDILALDAQRRQKVGELDNLRQQRKNLSKKSKTKKLSPNELPTLDYPPPIEDIKEKGRVLRNQIQELEEEVRDIDSRLEELLFTVPNPPQPDVPVGREDDDNVEVRTWGEPRTFDFEPAPHWQLGEDLDIIDFERGVKLSGSRFYVLKGLGSRLALRARSNSTRIFVLFERSPAPAG